MSSACGEVALAQYNELRTLALKHSPEFAIQLPYATAHEREAWLKLLRHIDMQDQPAPITTRADFAAVSAELADPERMAAAWKAVIAKFSHRRGVGSTQSGEGW